MTRERANRARSLLDQIDETEDMIKQLTQMKAEINSVDASEFKLNIEYVTPVGEWAKSILLNITDNVSECPHKHTLDNISKLLLVDVLDNLIHREQKSLTKLQQMLDYLDKE